MLAALVAAKENSLEVPLCLDIRNQSASATATAVVVTAAAREATYPKKNKKRERQQQEQTHQPQQLPRPAAPRLSVASLSRGGVAAADAAAVPEERMT